MTHSFPTRRSSVLVAGQHDDLGAESAEFGDRFCGSGAGGVGHADQAGGATVDGDKDGGAATLRELLTAVGELVELDPFAFHEPAVADHDALTVEGGDRKSTRLNSSR